MDGVKVPYFEPPLFEYVHQCHKPFPNEWLQPLNPPGGFEEYTRLEQYIEK